MELAGPDSNCRRPQRRKPLGDVTNVVAPSSPVAASSLKHRSGAGAKAKPGAQSVLGGISTRFKAKSVGSSCVSGDPEGRKGVASTSASQMGESLASSGHLEPSEGSILPSKRKRKIKWKEDVGVLQSSCPPIERTRSTGDNLKMHEDVDHHGACSVPCPKPKMKWRYTMSEAMNKRPARLPRDFIEKQKAYFAEIDAFELPEEEVASESELE